MRHGVLVGLLCVLPFTEAGASNRESESSAPVLERLFAHLRPVFERYYPEVVSRLGADGIAFEHDTRVFLVHRALKTGEWQEAHEVKGPNRGGILCHIGLREGRYAGAAILPQTFDERYFATLVMAVASPDESSYLDVHLSYPGRVEPGFLKDFHDRLQKAWGDEP